MGVVHRVESFAPKVKMIPKKSKGGRDKYLCIMIVIQIDVMILIIKFVRVMTTAILVLPVILITVNIIINE